MKLNEVAVIFGGTGLTGKHLVSLILGDPKFSEIIIVSRNKINLNHKKITNKIINFSKYEEIESSILKNSIVFSCIGTTMHQVNGNEKKYKSIDLDITVNIAKASKKVGAKKFLFISAARANSLSKNFYLKLKGDIENTVIDCNFKSVFIFRPSLLLGKRKEKRPIEKIVQRLKKTNKRPLLFKKNIAEAVKKIYLERRRTYNEADFRINCNSLKPEEIVDKIIKYYEASRN